MKKLPIIMIALLLGGVFSGCSIRNSSINKNAQKSVDNIQDISNNQIPEKSAVYSSLLMVDKTTGWVVRNNKVLRTINGGVDWTNVSPYSDSVTNDFQPIVSPCFYDSNIAYITLATSTNVSVYHTSDGGKQWDNTALPIIEQWESVGEEYISFSDLNNGFILVTSPPSCGQMDKSIYKTNDSGKSWLRIGIITDEIASYPTGMTFINNREGWITSSNHGQNYFLTFKSDDGGYSWHKENLQMIPIYKDYYTNSYPPVFIDNEKKIGILPIVYVKEESRFIVPYRTDDGGKSWAVTKALSNYDFSCYDFIKEKLWWMIDYDKNKLYETSDGGDNFEELSENEFFKKIKTMDFVTDKIGWAIGDDFFIKTINGGKDWNKVTMEK